MKSLKPFFIRTACMFILVSLSNSFNHTQAQVQPQTVLTSETAGSIRFVRTEGDMLVFEVHLANLPARGSRLRIIDGDYNTLYEQKISTATYNIRYKIAKGELSRINFEISGKKLFLNQSFTIQSRTEEKIEVSRA